MPTSISVLFESSATCVLRFFSASPLRSRRLRGRFFFSVLSVLSVLSLSTALILATPLAAQPPKKPPPAKPLDLNTATVEQLQQLPGIGPATAKAIVRFREKSGPFRRVEDLLAVRGITKARLEKLRPHLTVQPASKSGP